MHLLCVSVSECSRFNQMHLKVFFGGGGVAYPSAGEGNHRSGLRLCGENGVLDRDHISLHQ